MSFNHKEWLASLKTKYGVPDHEVPREAEDGWMRQSDYDSKFNTLKREHEERMRVEDEFRNQLVTQQNRLELLNQLEEQFGPAATWSDTLSAAIEGQYPQLGSAASGQVVTPDQLQRELAHMKAELGGYIQNIGTGAAVLIDFMADAPIQWRDRYKEPFPKKEFQEFFNASGITDPHKAFQLFEQPYAAKKQQEDFGKQLEDARQQGYQSAMSKYGNVETPPNMQTSGMFFKGGQPQVDPATGQSVPDSTSTPSYEERRARVGSAFVKALDDANGGKVPGASGSSGT
jgi:hypothetical protein